MTTKLNAEHSDFVLKYEWTIIEHLGLNLYSEVHSAISELIANAYDAEASKVEVTLPIGTPLGRPTHEITIRDNGHGMTYEDCRDKFLRVGLNRRRSSSLSKNGKRHVIGKKGIGKLAGFGIADVIEVRTIANGLLNEFRLSLAALRTAPEVATRKSGAGEDPDRADATRAYQPDLIRYNQQTTEESGTTVTLNRLRRLDAISFDDFQKRLARKFAIFGDDFEVTISRANSAESRIIQKFEVECQFRFPASGRATEVIDTPEMGPQEIHYWIGFTRATIKDDAVRGITIIANGKSVQEPFEFRITGGLTGQFGLQYMTGEVVADWLDHETKVDVIASDRSSVRWSDVDAHALLLWGQTKVRSLLEEWASLRAESTEEKIRVEDPTIYNEIDSYKGEARQELRRVVDRVVSTISQVGERRTKEVVQAIVVAYRHDHIRNVLKRVAEAQEGLQLFVEALDEWDLIDAVLTFQELSVKLAALQTLRVLVLGGATEVKSKSGHMSLSEHLASHPWLLDPMFSEMQHELNVDNFVTTRYPGEVGVGDDKRIDFIALYDSQRVRVVELKSSKDPVDLRGLANLQDYHLRVSRGELKRDQSRSVRSILIYNGKVTRDGEGALATIERDRDNYEVWTWQELLDRNDMIYKEMLQRVKEKNPTDPRVLPLWNALQDRMGPAKGAADRKRKK